MLIPGQIADHEDAHIVVVALIQCRVRQRPATRAQLGSNGVGHVPEHHCARVEVEAGLLAQLARDALSELFAVLQMPPRQPVRAGAERLTSAFAPAPVEQDAARVLRRAHECGDTDAHGGRRRLQGRRRLNRLHRRHIAIRVRRAGWVRRVFVGRQCLRKLSVLSLRTHKGRKACIRFLVRVRCVDARTSRAMGYTSSTDG
mmetsp:Transcript_13898/g.36035  ORF Transcript_13898/g.36035 Transcript_13898/m.36035 type:complete len:201 (-) Transcript_13898:97-699(-)